MKLNKCEKDFVNVWRKIELSTLPSCDCYYCELLRTGDPEEVVEFADGLNNLIKEQVNAD